MVFLRQKLLSNKSNKKDKNFRIMEETKKISKNSNNNFTNKLLMHVLTNSMLLERLDK